MRITDLPANVDTVTVRLHGKAFTVSRCAYVGGNERCAHAGTITDATIPGESTRWWCRWHYNCADANYGALVVEQSQERRADR